MTALRLRAVQRGWPGQSATDTDGFADAVTVALAVERRVAKRSETVNDLRRYNRASELIERFARSIPTPLNLPDLMVAANDLVASPGLTDVPADRIGASFHPPETLAAFEASLAASPGPAAPRIRTYVHAAMAIGAGVVVICEPDEPATLLHVAEAIVPPAHGTRNPELGRAYRATARTGDFCFASIPRRLKALSMLRRQIEASLFSGEPLPVGSQARHDVLAEGLREFAALPGGELRVIYVDGSEPAPFPAGLTPAVATDAVQPQMRLGLLSIRHPEHDTDVDAYWFRNRLVSTSDRTFAETDAYCARETVAQLTALSERGIRTFELVHTTGHECAAIGFYRGLSQWLAAGGGMSVHPRYMGYARIDLTGTTWAR
ncbi:MAG: hypothetical protein ACR2H2_01165 [Solirubrobacteraceae bacterium]